eukprot:scaffold73310_cov31-Tisochrysis_lutea.AAC.1
MRAEYDGPRIEEIPQPAGLSPPSALVRVWPRACSRIDLQRPAEWRPASAAMKAPAASDDSSDTIATLMRKQEELQQMRSAISELKGLQSNVQKLLRGGQPPASATPQTVDNEEDVLRGLLAKRAELQKMQEALTAIQGFASQSLSHPSTIEEEEEEEQGAEDETEDREAGGEEGEEELMNLLMRKHAELQRMRSAIADLQTAQDGASGMPAPKRAWEAKEEESESEDDEQPTTEAGWVRKLMQQQEELHQLRADLNAQQQEDEDDDEDDDEVRCRPGN